jgi:hypothetical protein
VRAFAGAVPPWPSETIAGSASHPSKSPLAPLPRSWISPRIFSTPVYEKSRLVVFGRNNPSPYTVNGRPLYVHVNGLAIGLLT